MSAKKGKTLMDCLTEIEDPRKPSNGKRHDFQEILVMLVTAILCGCDEAEEIAAWTKARETWLRRFLALKNGIASADTFLRILRLLDPNTLEATFRRWVSGILPALEGGVAIDGKSLRGSGTGGSLPTHLVSAFSTNLGMVLGQEKVSQKSNEISAIPHLLDALDLKGLLVSMDAMGCQKAIAKRIVAKKADYLLAVKDNQPGLRQRIADAFSDGGPLADRHEHLDNGHGRLVIQIARVLPAKGVVDGDDWLKVKTIGCIDSVRYHRGKESEPERRYYLSSRILSASELSQAARAHWGIENRLHWVLDLIMNEDASTIRKDNAPQNFSLLKKIALNLIRADQSDTKKTSLKIKRRLADWDEDFRMHLLGIEPI